VAPHRWCLGAPVAPAAFTADLGLVGRRLFEPLGQFLVARGYSEHPFPSARVIEGLGSSADFLGAFSRLSRE
jgi:hypothetical protein